MGICLICVINICHMSDRTIRKQRLIYLLPSCYKHIIGICIFYCFQYFLYIMANCNTFRLKLRIPGQNDGFTAIKRLPARQTFQCLPAHDHHFSQRFIPKQLLILRNTHQQMIILSNGPVFIHCNNNIHENISPLFLFLGNDQFLRIWKALDPMTERMPLL